MAKNNRRVKSKKPLLIPISNFETVDENVRRIRQLTDEIETLKSAAQDQIDQVKAELTEKTKQIDAAIDLRTKSIEAFCETNRDTFGCYKSKKLTFGAVGWRQSTSIKVNRKNTLFMIKESLTKKLRDQCIKTTETVSKDGLAKLTDEQLASVNARREHKDVFYVEPFIDVKSGDTDGPDSGE